MVSSTRSRYNDSLSALGYPPIPERPAQPYVEQSWSSCHSASTYSPSERSSVDTDDVSLASTHPSNLEPTDEYVHEDPHQTLLCTDDLSSLDLASTFPSPPSHSQQPITKTPTDMPSTTGTVTTPTADVQRIVTALQCNQQVTMDPTYRILTGNNDKAFKKWRTNHKNKRQLHAALQQTTSTQSAWDNLLSFPEDLISLCRHIPHPTILLLMIPESSIQRLGRVLVLEGYKHIFARLLSNEITDDARAVQLEWEKVITHASDLNTK